MSPSIIVRLRVQRLETLSRSQCMKEETQDRQDEAWAAPWHQLKRKRGLNEEFLALINPRTAVSVVPVLPPVSTHTHSKTQHGEQEQGLDEDAYAQATSDNRAADPEALRQAALALGNRACAVSLHAPLGRLRLLPQHLHGPLGPVHTDYSHALTVPLTRPLTGPDTGRSMIGTGSAFDPDFDSDEELLYVI